MPMERTEVFSLWTSFPPPTSSASFYCLLCEVLKSPLLILNKVSHFHDTADRAIRCFPSSSRKKKKCLDLTFNLFPKSRFFHQWIILLTSFQKTWDNGWHFGACSWKVAGWLLPKPLPGQRRETGTHTQVSLRLGALKGGRNGWITEPGVIL